MMMRRRIDKWNEAEILGIGPDARAQVRYKDSQEPEWLDLAEVRYRWLCS